MFYVHLTNDTFGEDFLFSMKLSLGECPRIGDIAALITQWVDTVILQLSITTKVLWCHTSLVLTI